MTSRIPAKNSQSQIDVHVSHIYDTLQLTKAAIENRHLSW